MPLRDFNCDKCSLKQEHFYHKTPDSVACKQCGGPLEMLPLSFTSDPRVTTAFPYVCKHLDGKGTPIVIENLAHLRRLEKQHGVVVHAFSQNPGNPDSPRDLPKFRE